MGKWNQVVGLVMMMSGECVGMDKVIKRKVTLGGLAWMGVEHSSSGLIRLMNKKCLLPPSCPILEVNIEFNNFR